MCHILYMPKFILVASILFGGKNITEIQCLVVYKNVYLFHEFALNNCFIRLLLKLWVFY